MRANRKLSISISPTQLREAERLAKRQNRSMSELVRDALRRYQREQSRRHTAAGVSGLAKAVDELREEADRKGAGKLTKSEIDAEIRAVRSARARRVLTGPVR